MTHRAFLAQYASCIVGLNYTPQERCLAALPLYHYRWPIPSAAFEAAARKGIKVKFCDQPSPPAIV